MKIRNYIYIFPKNVIYIRNYIMLDCINNMNLKKYEVKEKEYIIFKKLLIYKIVKHTGIIIIKIKLIFIKKILYNNILFKVKKIFIIIYIIHNYKISLKDNIILKHYI